MAQSNMPALVLPSNSQLAKGEDGTLYLVTQTINPVQIAGQPVVANKDGKGTSSLPSQYIVVSPESSTTLSTQQHTLLTTQKSAQSDSPSPVIAESIFSQATKLIPEESADLTSHKQPGYAASKKFKTVKVKMNGVVQTLLVPAIPEKGTVANPVQDNEVSQSNADKKKPASPPVVHTKHVLNMIPGRSLLNPLLHTPGQDKAVVVQKNNASPVALFANTSSNKSQDKSLKKQVSAKTLKIRNGGSTSKSESTSVLRKALNEPQTVTLSRSKSENQKSKDIEDGGDNLKIENVFSIRYEPHVPQNEQLGSLTYIGNNAEWPSLTGKKGEHEWTPQVDKQPEKDDKKSKSKSGSEKDNKSGDKAEFINIEPQNESVEFETATENVSIPDNVSVKSDTELKENEVLKEKEPTKAENKFGRSKRRVTTQGLGCRNCPGCNAGFMIKKRRIKQEEVPENSNCKKELMIVLTRVKAEQSKETPPLKRKNKRNTKKRVCEVARKSTAKRARNVSTSPEDETKPTKDEAKSMASGIVPALNFSKYYLVKSPAGTFLVPRATEIVPGEPDPVLFRVVAHNTGRAVAIRTTEGVQKMFVQAMDRDDTAIHLKEHLSKLPGNEKMKINPPKSPKIKVKSESFAQEFCDRKKNFSENQRLKEPEQSDTDTASEITRKDTSASDLNETIEHGEEPEPPVLESELSADERLEKLMAKLKSQMAKLDEVRSSTENAKRVLESIDEDDD